MKILSIISFTFLIVFAVGCDEMQNQAMKPIMMPDDETPPEDSIPTSVGMMKDPSMESDDSTEDTPPDTQTMEEDPPDEPQIPDATSVTASPASGNISENGSISLTFDNDPGEVTVSEGTVSGSGTTRTISGPFPVGSLTLTISWTNGDGNKTLNYNVIAEDTTAPEVSTSSLSDGAVDVDPTTVSDSGITVTFDESISSHQLKLLKDGVDVGWTVSISVNTITLTKSTGQELSHDTTYKISGTVKDNADNETTVSISFTTKSAPTLPPLTAGEGLRIGVTAPTFSVQDSYGNTYDFDGNINGSSNIVILFTEAGGDRCVEGNSVSCKKTTMTL